MRRSSKQTVAASWAEFNDSLTFRELFPDLVKEIEEKLEKINEMKKQNAKEASEKAASEGNQVEATTNHGAAYNLFTNVIILVMFGIFICIVKKVYESGEQDE